MKRCTWPIEKPDAVVPCNRRAVLVFTDGRIEYPRCRLHASKAARSQAEASGFAEVVA